jgi:hypothetical protein
MLEMGKVDIDSKDWGRIYYNNQRPLLWAAEKGYDAVVKLLRRSI